MGNTYYKCDKCGEIVRDTTRWNAPGRNPVDLCEVCEKDFEARLNDKAGQASYK